MIEYKKAKVLEVFSHNNEIDEVILDIDHRCKKAYNYKKITGNIDIGDIVIVNTTACSLNLGTGGYHFIIANLDNPEKQMNGLGHGMKLKYTPQQVRVLLCEEESSPYHELFYNPLILKHKVVFIGELHSMLMPLCAYLKYQKEIKISSIITDHGALPLFFSRNIRILKEAGLLDSTISIGNAFGGDFECVNIYTGLQMALNILDSDVAIITMGPGILGTNTPFGFSGLEMGFYIDLIRNHGGNVLYIPRMSFDELRGRHYGISHHTLNILSHIVRSSIPLVFPIMNRERTVFILNQLKEHNLLKRNTVIFSDGRDIAIRLKYFGLEPDTMGRGIAEDPVFFSALGAVGRYGLSLLDKFSFQ